MSQTFRHPEILDLARKEGKVTVEGLAQHFGVTLQTIRRDLSDLARAGQLERVHGGAVLAAGAQNIEYRARRSLNAAGKAAIARACAARIAPGSSLSLNIGTTTEAVAEALRGHAGLLVVTNNINVATLVAQAPDSRCVLTGGDLRPGDGGLVGPLAAHAVEGFRCDVAVVGCSALDAQGTVLDYDMAEVIVSQAMLARARRRILVADRTKLSRNAPIRIAGLEALDMVICDAPLPAPLAQACAAHGVEVIVAPPLPE